MRNKMLIILLIACAGLIITACTTFQASGLQVGMSSSGTEVLGNFSTTVYINKFFGASGGANLLNLGASATSGPIRNAIDKEIQKKGGTAAINISIKYSASLLQMLLNSITGTIWAPATITITGTIIRQN